MSEHPSVAAARLVFEGFRRGDVSLELLSPDAVWHVPGANAMAGVELVWAVGDDERLVAVYRARGKRPDGRTLDIEQALLIRLDSGSWREIRAQPLDQSAFDAFWN